MSMPETQDKKPSGLRPGLRYLLIGSLAVNFIIAGLMVGATVGNKRSGDRPPREGDILGAYTHALSGDQRRALGRSIRDHHREQSGGPMRPREVLDMVLVALRAEPFNPEPLRVLIEQQMDTAYARRKVAQELWVQHVTKMTDAERAEYADRIVESLSKRKGPPKRN